MGYSIGVALPRVLKPPMPMLLPARDLPGSVYFVPDRFWKWDAPGRVEHPGACAFYNATAMKATVVPGTDARGAAEAKKRIAIVVRAGPTNGLEKDTAFLLAPRVLKLDVIAPIHHTRRLGRLDADDLTTLQRTLKKLFAVRG